MKLIVLTLAVLGAMQAHAVDQSTAVGKDTTAGNFTASVVRPFVLKDGTVVESSRQIRGLRYRSVWLGGARMTLVVNGAEKHFKVPKDVYIDRGYPMSYVNTSAGSTGQGIGIRTRNEARGSQSSYTKIETDTCYSSSFDVCLRKDPSICRYNVRASGSEQNEVEFTEQGYRATVTLSDSSGATVAKLGYDTKDFNRRTLRTVSACDAEYNVGDKQREVRRELRSNNPVDKEDKPGKRPGKKPRKR